MASATLSQMLIRKVGLKDDAVLFTASLLHDVGKLVLDRYIAENPKELSLLMQKDGLTFVQAEKEIFGMDHAELGGMIADAWRFPISLVNSIKNHHANMVGKIIPNMESWVRLSNLSYYVSLADEFCRHHEGISCQVDQSILFQFGLKAEHIPEILRALPEEMRVAEEMLRIEN